MSRTQFISQISFLSIIFTSFIPIFSQTDVDRKGLTAADASGETITVTTLEDVSDFTGVRQVGNLPGPDGRISFREAVTAANNTPGPQTIAFAIPTSEFWLITNTALIKVERGPFFLEDDATTVDFSTQTTNIGDTNPTGPDVGMYGLEANGWGIAAIYMNGDNCVIKGLGDVYQRGYAARIVGNNNRVIGCDIQGPLHAAVMIGSYIGSLPPTGNLIGGTATGEGNILSGIRINGPANQTTVLGNLVTNGLYVQGATQYGVEVHNTRIGGPTPAERNVISGNGRFGEEGFPTGTQLSVGDANDTIVEGNYIGTTADGMAAWPNQTGPTGLSVYDSRRTTVRGNLIAGLRVVGRNHYAGQIFGKAIDLGGSPTTSVNALVERNTIGLAADGVTPILTRSGITVTNNSPSGSAPGGTRVLSNHIAFVERNGIVVESLANGITISGNSIHDSGLLGIDLFANSGGLGVTPNDPGDGDTGANGLQNFPVLISAATTGSSVTVEGTLDSVPSEQFTVEFFASPACDPSGYGEGALFLGSALVTTDAAGRATFTRSLPGNAPAGWAATATATRILTGDTSEFSACAPFAQASGISISGRVLTPEGRAIRDATVTLTNSQGSRWTATVFGRGNYKFTGIPSGEMYTFTVESARYRFTPQQMMLTENVTDMNLIGSLNRMSRR